MARAGPIDGEPSLAERLSETDRKLQLTLPPELWSEPISAKQLLFVGMTIGFLAVAIPAAIKYPWMDRVCMAGILFMAINPVDVTFFSYTPYRGDIRGVEFGVTDWLTITLIVAMIKAPRWRKRQIYTRNPNEIWMALYLGYSALTIATAVVPQFAFFGVTKLMRAYATFWVAYNFIRNEDDLRFIIWCVVGLTFYSFTQVLMDKYTRGVFPPRGSFPHQNGLVTFQNMMNFVIFAVLMQDSDKLFDKRTLIYWAALGAGALTSVATLSRGGMATMVMGFMMIMVMAFFLKQGPSKIKKKFAAIGIMILLSIPALAVILPPIIERFETAPKESGESRHDANIASAEMGHDYFFGVGINNYSYAINFMHYGEHLSPLDRGIAHHIFWLHYAEMGVIGVTLYTLLTGTFMWIAVRFIFKRRDSLERVFAIGILTGFAINWLVGTLEWNFRIIQITVAYFMLAGFLTSLDRVERERIQQQQDKKNRLMLWYLMMTRRSNQPKPTLSHPPKQPARPMRRR
ncbi:MAG: O-antigen ligase family protein [Thiocapsa sp.]|uniref:O-antigen ligase family protein n=1 Tax=Thiocapsa sp. TaxID=2024551 RepID=UPI001BCD6C9A|nr:O-antigen ligase family protein [Thiocapsa sp.]QVL47476.1 MAG: O-antigen ligase family protein [Thiocapsa sp.]